MSPPRSSVWLDEIGDVLFVLDHEHPAAPAAGNRHGPGPGRRPRAGPLRPLEARSGFRPDVGLGTTISVSLCLHRLTLASAGCRAVTAPLILGYAGTTGGIAVQLAAVGGADHTTVPGAMTAPLGTITMPSRMK